MLIHILSCLAGF